MNRPRCTDTDYVDFLVATPRAVSGTEAARTTPRRADAPAHDAFTRLLHRLKPDPATLWQEVSSLIERGHRVLVVDDTTLDKPYAKKIELVHRHWSGNHHAVVDGINLITLLWSEGESLIPCDWRVFDKPNDGITKNEHLAAMLLTAEQRGFAPECVAFDSWYASIDGCPLGGMRLIRDRRWRWLTQLKSNRLGEPGSDGQPGGVRLRDCRDGDGGPSQGLRNGEGIPDCHPSRGHGVLGDERCGHGRGGAIEVRGDGVGIAVYHRALKQECGVERAMMRAGRAQRNHIGMAIRAFVRLEWHRLRTGIAWGRAKEGIISHAIRSYRARPWYRLPASA